MWVHFSNKTQQKKHKVIEVRGKHQLDLMVRIFVLYDGNQLMVFGLLTCDAVWIGSKYRQQQKQLCSPIRNLGNLKRIYQAAQVIFLLLWNPRSKVSDERLSAWKFSKCYWHHSHCSSRPARNIHLTLQDSSTKTWVNYKTRPPGANAAWWYHTNRTNSAWAEERWSFITMCGSEISHQPQSYGQGSPDSRRKDNPS